VRWAALCLLALVLCDCRGDKPEQRASVALSSSSPSPAPSPSATAVDSAGSPLPSGALPEAYRRALARGRAATRRGDLADARAAFQQALDVVPGDARALSERGFAEMTLPGGTRVQAWHDVEDALFAAKDRDLKASIWFNLGVLRAADAESSRAAFAMAHHLAPSAATRDKLAGRSPCPARIDAREVEPLQVVESWRALRNSIDGEAAPDDAAARAAVCLHDDNSAASCDGKAMTFVRGKRSHQWPVYVAFERRGGGFLAPKHPWVAGSRPARCFVGAEPKPRIEDGVLVIQVERPGSEPIDPENFSEGMECRQTLGEVEHFFYDGATGAPLMVVVWDELMEIAARVAGGKVVLEGSGCHERLPLDRGERAKARMNPKENR
jgi:hypothetical protein